MQKLTMFAVYILFCAGVCFAQFGDTSSSPSSQSTQSQGISIDCSDPSQAGSAECSGVQSQQSQRSNVGGGAYPSQGTPQLRTLPGFDTGLTPRITPLNPSEIQQRRRLLLRPETEFEQMVADSVGRP